MVDDRPWRDRNQLTALLQRWRRDLVGRTLFRTEGGPGWTGLWLDGDDRPGIYLFARPGACLLLDHRGRLPAPLPDALQRSYPTPLAPHLRGCRLTGVGLLLDDAVVALDWQVDGNQERRTLLHQLFGPRGNTVLLDARARLLWALHRPLHSVLTQPPPAATWETGDRPLPAADGTGGRFGAAALQFLARNLETELHDRLSRALRQRSERAERLVANLTRDFATADHRADFRRDAETLAVHLHELQSGLAEVELPAPHDGQRRRIALDPALSGPANMERYFRRARKADRGHALIGQRLADARTTATALTAIQTELEALITDLPAAVGPAPQDPEPTPQEPPPTQQEPRPPLAAPRLQALLALRASYQELLGDLSRKAPAKRGARSPDEPTRPFRRYLIEGRWEVWIGRNAAENDQLTHRAAALRDLWFHAQSVGGSHVILRTGGKPEQVPRRVLEKAAALAALHSKDRHAGMVPVIWTERRYVRKPRKSPLGRAVCLRHESLFAEPTLPPDAEPI